VQNEARARLSVHSSALREGPVVRRRIDLVVRSLAVPLLFALGCVTLSRDARPADFDAELERRGYELELGAKAGYLSPPTAGYVSPFGVGLGGRLGAVFSGFYVGVSVVDYLGGGEGSISERSLLYGVDVGYGFRLGEAGGGFFVLRPQLGAGGVSVSRTDSSKVDVISTASGTVAGSGQTTTASNLYLEPSLGLTYTNGAHYVAVYGDALVVPNFQYDAMSGAVTWTSYGARLEAGFRF
jgi:hypothetical protein